LGIEPKQNPGDESSQIGKQTTNPISDRSPVGNPRFPVQPISHVAYELHFNTLQIQDPFLSKEERP
jgi:hypothetical protein